VITARFVWMYPATYLPHWLFPALKRRDPAPPWQWPFVLAFTGVRGIVSLAAALAIPLATVNGQPFPYRDLTLFLTFAVILVTLVGQGLMLPWVIRALGLADAGRRERHADRAEEQTARQQAIEEDRKARPAGGGTPTLRGNGATAPFQPPRPAKAYQEPKR
jgi:monovalent cation/hydrogen antiporter